MLTQNIQTPVNFSDLAFGTAFTLVGNADVYIKTDLSPGTAGEGVRLKDGHATGVISTTPCYVVEAVVTFTNP